MESQYYRTFIAAPLRVEGQFLQARQDLITALKGERISWTNPDQYHVTLRFIGDTELDDVKKIGDALHEGIHVPERISLNTAGLGSFGPRKRPRVIWVGFEDRDFFELLTREVDAILEKCGIPVRKQAFRAHLTLGRVRSLKKLPEYYLTLEEMKQQFPASVLFEKLVFFRSILSPQGPEYQVLNELEFR